MFKDIHFWRQVLIVSANIICSMCMGFMIPFPSILNPVILSPNSTDIKATPDQASWIAASNGFAGLIGFFILSPMLQVYGRKPTFITVNLFFLTGWIIISLADGTRALLAGRIIQGLAIGAIYICNIIVSEYSDPTRRGRFVVCKKVGTASGALMCHALSIIWSWRQIAIFAAILPMTSIVITFFWPESPYYLAMKGRFHESEKSFTWIHGESNMKELCMLFASQKEKVKTLATEKWYRPLLKKDFIKPFLIASISTLLLDLSGKYYFVVSVLQMMVQLIGDKSKAMYCTLGADCLIILALIFSSFIINYFKRRIMLFTFGLITAVLMLLIYLLIIFKLSNITWLVPVLILLVVFIANIGVIPVCFALISEIFPLERKGNGSFATGIVFSSIYALILKITPMLIESSGVQGVFMTYGIGIIFCLVVLYFIVPETKDKTLQEIENDFKGIKAPMYNEDVKKVVAKFLNNE